jgi:anti-sigma regulatory factor (Ser/Thr protein kinase)
VELELEPSERVQLTDADGRTADADATTAVQATGDLQLAPVPSSVRIGRRFAARALTDWEVPPEQIEDAVLIVSELVTNAIVHGSPPVRLRLRRTAAAVTIEVEDGGGERPRRRWAGTEAHGGRGLAIVATLSGAWAVQPHGGGKCVQSVLTVSR